MKQYGADLCLAEHNMTGFYVFFKLHKAKLHKVIENNEGLGGGLVAWQGVSMHVVAISCKFVFRFGMLAWGAILFFTKGEGERARTGRRCKAPRGCTPSRGNSTFESSLPFSTHYTKSMTEHSLGLTERLARAMQERKMRNFSSVPFNNN